MTSPEKYPSVYVPESHIKYGIQSSECQCVEKQENISSTHINELSAGHESTYELEEKQQKQGESQPDYEKPQVQIQPQQLQRQQKQQLQNLSSAAGDKCNPEDSWSYKRLSLPFEQGSKRLDSMLAAPQYNIGPSNPFPTQAPNQKQGKGASWWRRLKKVLAICRNV